jgi:hypothetical protein
MTSLLADTYAERDNNLVWYLVRGSIWQRFTRPKAMGLLNALDKVWGLNLIATLVKDHIDLVDDLYYCELWEAFEVMSTKRWLTSILLVLIRYRYGELNLGLIGVVHTLRELLRIPMTAVAVCAGMKPLITVHVTRGIGSSPAIWTKNEARKSKKTNTPAEA